MRAKEGVNYTSNHAELPGQTEMDGCQRHVPVRLCTSLGRPHGNSGRERRRENILPTPGMEPRTVHSVADRYTGYAIPAPFVS